MLNIGNKGVFLQHLRICQKQENDHISAKWLKIKKIKALSSLEILMYKEAKCFFSIDFQKFGRDVAIFSFPVLKNSVVRELEPPNFEFYLLHMPFYS